MAATPAVNPSENPCQPLVAALEIKRYCGMLRLHPALRSDPLFRHLESIEFTLVCKKKREEIIKKQGKNVRKLTARATRMRKRMRRGRINGCLLGFSAPGSPYPYPHPGLF